jgi:hypothetical protein
MKAFSLFSFVIRNLFIFNWIFFLCKAQNCLHTLDYLSPGGPCLISRSNLFSFCLSSSGGACIRRISNGNVTWCINVVLPIQDPFEFVLQVDGNIVAYRVGNVPYWATNLMSYSTPYADQAVNQYLILQDDGNFVHYKALGVVRWACNWQQCPLSTPPDPDTNELCNNIPTVAPTQMPTRAPTAPTVSPTRLPTVEPTRLPTLLPTSQPSRQPSSSPSAQPSSTPTRQPTSQPSRRPTAQPTRFPTAQPSRRPSSQPSRLPTGGPSSQPLSQPTSQPTRSPTGQPSHCPSRQPIGSPSSVPTRQPTSVPSSLPTTQPSSQPTVQPSGRPTVRSSGFPTTLPTTQPTSVPSSQPSSQPSSLPSGIPSSFPSSLPSSPPTGQPTVFPSSQPSLRPTTQPSGCPSVVPTSQPSSCPTTQPSVQPTDQPTDFPSSQPTVVPSTQPSFHPSGRPSAKPSRQPSVRPTCLPTGSPSFQPSSLPTGLPSRQPSTQPSSRPSRQPSGFPTSGPSSVPSRSPTSQPSVLPTSSPTHQPTSQPLSNPTVIPSFSPTVSPTNRPTRRPSSCPSSQPSSTPSSTPSRVPTVQPTRFPSSQPSSRPSLQPAASPSSVPTRFPSTKPTTQPTGKPSRIPILIESAYFRSNGAAVVVKLSDACPTLFTEEKFPCGQYFEFPCANTSVCQWKDFRSIEANIPAVDKCVKPGDVLRVTSLSVANPLCQMLNEKNCLNLPTDVRKAIVNFPVNPVIPTVSFNLPPSLSYCSALTFDLSNSVGNLGRPWESIQVSVKTDKPSNLASLDLERFVQSKYGVKDPQLAPPLQISSSYFTVNTEYSFTVRLCNFLGACHQDSFSTKIISSSLPPVTILRVTPAEMTRSQPLSLRAFVQKTNCNESINLNDLQFNWTISRKSKLNTPDILENSIKSSSRDGSRFTLSPYALQSNETYVILLRMTYLSGSSATSILVKVLTGQLVAVIAGNDQQKIRSGELHILDGSESYDEDHNNGNTVVSSARLKYLWSCQPISSSPPVTSCLQIFRSGLFLSSLHSSSLKLNANESSANTTVKITLTVSDLITGRTASTVITMSILPRLYPVTTLSTAVVATKMNPSESLQIIANISLPSVGLSGNISWQSIPSLTLSSIATPISQSFRQNMNSSSVVFYLVILPNSLFPGQQYSFGLRCQLNENIIATNYISIVVNAPPSAGSFLVDPQSGTAFVDVFHFTCNNWIDSDLPLSYQFSYRSPTGVNLIMKTVGPLSYSSTVLPEGKKNGNIQNEIICVGEVYDSLNANSTRFHSIQVNSLLHVNVSGLVSTFLDPRNAIDLDDLLLGVNLASSLLNQPNCSLAPNCASLNRLPCITTSHTCGSCKTSYISSTSGDGNEKCLKIDNQSNTGTKDKECTLKCSSRGNCIYYSQTTGKRIENCFEGDFSCYSSCACQDGYRMSQYCEIPDEETQSYLRLRELIVETIVANTDSQDRSEQVVSGWMNSLLTIAQVPNQISEKSLTSLLDLSELAVKVVQSEGFSATNTLSTYLDGLDNLASVIPVLRKVVNRLSRRKLELQQASLTERIDQNLKKYSNVILNSMVPGQSAVQEVKSNFKLHLETLALTSKNNRVRRKLTSTSVAGECAETASFTLDQSPLEEALKTPLTTLSIPTCTTSSLQVGIRTLSSSLYNNPEVNFTSNPVSLSLSSHVCVNDKECGVFFSMDSHNHGAGRLVHPAVNRSVDCDTNDFTNHTVACSTGSMNKNYTVHCRGINERITIQCPSVSLFPTCNALSGNTVANIGCETKSFGNDNITCFCPLNTHSSASSSSLKSTDITVVAFLDNVGDNFVDTIFSAQHLNVKTLSQSPEAMITICVFLGCILMFMLFSVYTDGLTKKRISTEEKLMNHAKVYSLYQHKIESQSRISEKENTDKEMNLFQLVEAALPDILNAPSLNERIWKEEKKFHRYLGIVYYFSAVFPRVLRVVSLASNIIIMLFIQSLTYNYTHGNDGSCELFTTEETCLESKSYYGTGKSKCSWKKNAENECEFIQPENSIEIILFVAVFSGLVSAPLAVLVDWIILNVLSAPDPSDMKVQAVDEKAISKENSVLILPVNERIPEEIAEPKFNFSTTSSMKEKYLKLVENDYRNLFRELLNSRNSISSNEQHRQELDHLWVLKGENPLLFWELEKTDQEYSVERLLQRLGGLISSTLVGKQSISKSLHQELHKLYSNLEKERTKFEILKSERAKSKRLLYLFQKDLIPGIYGEILETKSSRDNIILSPVSLKKKTLAWGFLLLLDLGMLFYVFLFAISQDSHRQLAWGRSLGIYLLLDIVFISTFMVIFMHVLLPSMIMRDIGEIKEKVRGNIQSFYEKKLIETKENERKEAEEAINEGKPLHLKKRGRSNSKLRKMEGENPSETDCVSFNSVKYLFLSFRLAELYPTLPASQIILQYSSPWPKQSYSHINDVKSNYSDKYSAIKRAISIIVIFLLTNLLASPAAIQDMILQMITLVMMGFLLLVHIQLYYLFPVFVIIPSVVLIAGVYTIYYYFFRSAHLEQQNAKNNDYNDKNNNVNSSPQHMPAKNSQTITTRRQSLQQGIQLASQLQRNIISRSSDEKEHSRRSSEERASCSNESGENSDSDSDEDDDDESFDLLEQEITENMETPANKNHNRMDDQNNVIDDGDQEDQSNENKSEQPDKNSGDSDDFENEYEFDPKPLSEEQEEKSVDGEEV